MNTREYISVNEIDKDKLIIAVQEMANLYGDNEFSKGIQVIQSIDEKNDFILNFSSRLDFDTFMYFVNYLHYHNEVENYQAKVRGFWTVKRNDGLPENHTNQRVMLYIPNSDEDGDNVYVTFQQQASSIKLGFAYGHEYKMLNKIVMEFNEPKLNKAKFNLLKTIDPDSNAKMELSGKGCLLCFSLLIAGSIWLIFS